MLRAAVLLALIATPALAAPAPINDPFPRIQPSGLALRMVPFVTIPPDGAVTGPAALIQYVTVAPDGSRRLFINDLNGTIFRTDQAGTAPVQFLDVRTTVPQAFNYYVPTGPGLAGLAFHPNFGTDPAKPGFATFYTGGYVHDDGALAPAKTIGTASPNGSTDLFEVREWTATDPAAATFQGTSRPVLRVSGGASNAMIAFNPTAAPGTSDYGNLYIALSQNEENDANAAARNLALPYGKLLRINPLAQGADGYTVPADNPYVLTPGDLPEIYVSGLRNPQTFGWDKATGTMYINDLGEARIEEVNVGIKGADYGWSTREGPYATGAAYGLVDDYNIYPRISSAPDGTADPVACYSHNEGYAIGSGYLYRGSALPSLYGHYIMADIVLGRILTFDPAQPGGGTCATTTVTEIALTGPSGGAQLDLTQLYGYPGWFNSPRVDARLSPDADGEPLLLLKATGVAYSLLAQDVPEPATLALLAPLALLARRTRAGTVAKRKAE